MRPSSIVFLTAFFWACASDPGNERASGSGGQSTSSGNGGATSGPGTGTGTTTNATTGPGTGGSTGGPTSTGPTGSGGATGTSTSGPGGRGGSSSGGSPGTGGSPADASVDTGPPPDPGPLSGGGAGCNDADPVHQGSATFYTLLSPTNTGHCSFTPLPTEPPYWAAMNGARYNGGTDCGACVEATNGGNTKTFIVVDECPVNSTNCDRMEHIDMFTTGFSAIGGSGIINSLSWKYVPCPVQGNVKVFIPSTASKFNAPVNIRNHRYRIKSFEVVQSGMRIAVKRGATGDNVWVLDSTFPPGSLGLVLSPFRIRITDIYGHWIENKVTLVPGQAVDLGLQFPACPAGGDAGT
jgi:expansin (peptidoglycan-binding protein)